MKEAKPRYRPTPEEEKRLTEAFLRAAFTGDAEGLRAVLADDVVMHADGGGKASANLNPVYGLEKAIRLVQGVLRKFPPPPGSSGRLARINGQPGAVLIGPDGAVIQTTVLELRDGRICAAYTVRNPQKLKHIRLEA